MKKSTADRTPDNTQYWTTEEVANLFRVKPRTVRDWIRKGEIKAFKRGAAWLIDEEELKNQKINRGHL